MKNTLKKKTIAKLTELAESIEPVSKARLAAAVLYKNKIIAVGFNQYKTHPLMEKFKKNPAAIFLHAEVDAINKASKILTKSEITKASLMVLRIKKDGEYAIAKPCPGCGRAISHYGIKHICYSNNKGEFEWETSL